MEFPGGPSGERTLLPMQETCKRCRFYPGWGRFPRGGHSNPLQNSCLENPMGRGAWWATIHGVAKSWTWPEWFGTHELQHARLSNPSVSPGICSNSSPLSWWCHPTISSSVVPFSSWLQSSPACVTLISASVILWRCQLLCFFASKFPRFVRTLIIEVGPTLIPHALILTWLYLQRPYFLFPNKVTFPSSTREAFLGCSDGKESACNAGDPGSHPRSGRSLEKGTENHSSILVWRIPWTEVPGGL